jgi:hypothetical protein
MYIFPVAPTLENRASVKRFLSLQFLNPKTAGIASWTGDQPVAKPPPTKDNTDRHACLEWESNPRFQCLSVRRQFMP